MKVTLQNLKTASKQIGDREVSLNEFVQILAKDKSNKVTKAKK